jgi:hypothetical protein
MDRRAGSLVRKQKQRVLNKVPRDCRQGLEFRLRLGVPKTCVLHVLI